MSRVATTTQAEDTCLSCTQQVAVIGQTNGPLSLLCTWNRLEATKFPGSAGHRTAGPDGKSRSTPRCEPGGLQQEVDLFTGFRGFGTLGNKAHIDRLQHDEIRRSLQPLCRRMRSAGPSYIQDQYQLKPLICTSLASGELHVQIEGGPSPGLDPSAVSERLTASGSHPGSGMIVG